MKARVSVAALYTCFCPLAAKLHTLPAGAQRVKKHESTKGHQNWLISASQEHKDLLEIVKYGGDSAIVGLDPAEVRSCRAKFDQWFVSEGFADTAAVQEEQAWRFVLRELGPFDSSPATRQALFEFWCSMCFSHRPFVGFNKVTPRPSSSSFVFQFIVGKYGVHVCTTWGAQSGATHTVDGVPINVSPRMIHDLIKIMTFDITTNNTNGVPQLPYQFIESPPNRDTLYVYAFVHISGKPHYMYRSVWESTLRLFGWDGKDTSTVVESYSGAGAGADDNYLKLSSRFTVEMRTLEKDIIPLYIYYLKVKVSADEDWSRKVSCGIRGQLIADRSLSLDGTCCFVPTYSSSKSIDAEILTSLVASKDKCTDRSFTRPDVLLSTMCNKSSYYPFKTRGCRVVALTCDNNGKPTWEIDASSAVVRDRILPILRDSGEEFHAVFIDRVRRFERLEIAFLEIHLYGIGSQCTQCSGPAPVYIEQKGTFFDSVWVECRACSGRTKRINPLRDDNLDQLRAVPRNYDGEKKLCKLLRDLTGTQEDPEEALKAATRKKALKKMKKGKAEAKCQGGQEAEGQDQEAERQRQEMERQQAEHEVAEDDQLKEAKRQQKEEEKQGEEPKKKKRRRAKMVEPPPMTWEEARALMYGPPEEVTEKERQRIEEVQQREEKQRQQDAARRFKEAERQQEYKRQRQEDEMQKERQRQLVEPKPPKRAQATQEREDKDGL